jgi:hypothetical protein
MCCGHLHLNRDNLQYLVQLHATGCPILGSCLGDVSHHLRHRLGGPVEGMRRGVPCGHDLFQLGLQVGQRGKVHNSQALALEDRAPLLDVVEP